MDILEMELLWDLEELWECRTVGITMGDNLEKLPSSQEI